MSTRKRNTRTECAPSSGTKKCRHAKELAELRSKEIDDGCCGLPLPTIKVKKCRNPTAAIETLEVNDVQWQEQAAKKISDLYYALNAYKCAVKRTKVLQTKKLERMETELLEETERLILCLSEEKRQFENLKKQQANLVNTQTEYGVMLPVAGETANAILQQNKNAFAEELVHVRGLCMTYLAQLDSALEVVEGRKQTAKLKLDFVATQLAVKKMLVKDLRKQLKKEQKSADSKILELRVRNEDETREKLDALLTPKIAKMMKRRDDLMKVWNNGLGEKCEGCGKVLKIDNSGSFSYHRTCLKKLH